MEAKFRALGQQIRASFQRDKHSPYLVYDEAIARQFIASRDADCVLPIGCHVIRNALDFAQQIKLTRACLEEYSQSPFNNVSLNHPDHAFTREEYFKKLRWSCLGYEYDWQNRCYLEESRLEFPKYLQDLSLALTSSVGLDEDHLPDGAIINYYRANSIMGPHRDDVEPALNKPLISISLGCDAIFLIETKPFEIDSNVTALHLRSGDVVILSGPARLALHSVAVIFFGSFTALPTSREGGEDKEENLEWIETLRRTRLNLNIKQVADPNSFEHSFEGWKASRGGGNAAKAKAEAS